MKKSLLLSLVFTGLFILGCGKKAEPPKVEVPAEEAPAAVAEVNQDSIASAAAEESLRQTELENQRLEQQRSLLEDMMNRLMAEEIYFEFDKASLSEKARELLAEAADIMQREPSLVVEVQGHTDERGAEAYNMALGGKRAQSVVQYLIDYGVAGSRLKSVSFGEEAPKAEGASEEAYALNRRAAFKVEIVK